MKINLRFLIKTLIRFIVLPIIQVSTKNKKIVKDVIFVDTHTNGMPFSMRALYDELCDQGRKPETFFVDTSKLPIIKRVLLTIEIYNVAASYQYVVLSNNSFLFDMKKPNPQNVVIQLWHSCGVLKKFGYDSNQDIPALFRFLPSYNYDFVTISGEECLPVFKSAMNLKKEKFVVSGVSRTDLYYDTEFNDESKVLFNATTNNTENKNVLVAMTFRGYASDTSFTNIDYILESIEGFNFLISDHPHSKQDNVKSKDEITSEYFLGGTDILISDFSSIVYDFLVYNKPIILYVPDLDDYVSERGLYIDLNETPFMIAKNPKELEFFLINHHNYFDEQKYHEFRNKYMEQCDGEASKRIIKNLMNKDLKGELLND